MHTNHGEFQKAGYDFLKLGDVAHSILSNEIDRIVEFLKFSLGTKEKAERQAKYLFKQKMLNG